MRYFYVVKIENRNIRTVIDGIRFICNPNIKHPAHITLRGPYKRTYNISKKQREIKYQNIDINETGTFFNPNQNTVFLKCEGDILNDIIMKKDYSNDNPHITLYDGENRGFANKLLKLISQYHIKFQITPERIELLMSNEKDEIRFSNNNVFDSDFINHLSYYLNSNIDIETIKNLDDDQKLILIEQLLKHFKNWNDKKAFPSPTELIIEKLGYKKANGLFYFNDYDSWKEKFPYRIVKALREIKPYAFFHLYNSIKETESDHPDPFNQPLILFFSNPSKNDELNIHRKIFNFGHSPVVIIDRLNQVNIYNGFEFEDKSRTQLTKIGSNRNVLNFHISKIFHPLNWKQIYEQHFKSSKKIDEYLLENITEARKALLKLNLSSKACNNLIGNLLFIRYLIDRGVSFVNDDNKIFIDSNNPVKRRIEFLYILKHKELLYEFFQFLKNKFKGDLFPNIQDEFQFINQDHLNLLHALFKGAKIGELPEGYFTQDSLFDVYDFSIIPIELISNIYETFMGDSKRFQNKAFYTPPFLVDYVLNKTVIKYLQNTNSPSCSVLDPACGSGIFLIETLRKLIEKELDNSKTKYISDIKLWKIVKENIYGIDIDSDAIDIAIFSLYVTILDYKEPKEISQSFEFQSLKYTNFFPGSDFFDENADFNKILKNKKINFIIGNPPWGQVRNSIYNQYCTNRELNESNNKKTVSIGISDEQIAQAFIIRSSDFSNSITQCAFVVTSKVLYNTNAITWRKYFLTNFIINEIIELSAVKNKLFEGANWPSAIIFYRSKSLNETIENNIINLISVKPNIFFKYFRTVVIEKYDFKKIKQILFLEEYNGHDWLWKVLLYGSIFDYFFIKRLKEQYKTIRDLIEENDLIYGVGLKRKDGVKKPDASDLKGIKFLDTSKKELTHFKAIPSKNWDEDFAGNIPRKHSDKNNFPSLFKPPLALIKEGLDTNYSGVAAFVNEKIVFTHSVRAIKGSENSIDLLKSIVAMINSELFAYYIFNVGTSTGIDFIRANQIEQITFPIINNDKLPKLVDQISNLNSLKINENAKLIDKLNLEIKGLFKISPLEMDLISYTQEVSIPLTRESTFYKPIRKITYNDKVFIEKYVDRILEYFSTKNQYFKVEILIDEYFIGINFKVNKLSTISWLDDKKNNLKKIIHSFYNLQFEDVSKQVFIQKDLKIFNEGSFIIVKPNELKNWHSAISWIDLGDLIHSSISNRYSEIDVYENIFKYASINTSFK